MKNRAEEAAKKAIHSPLLETTIEGAKGVILNVTGGPDLGILEVKTAAELVEEAADSDANIIIGAIIDENLGDELVITVIATGFKGMFQVSRRKRKKPIRFQALNGMGNLSSTQSAPSYNQAPPQPAPSYTPPSPTFEPAPSSNLFSKVGEDDGIDVPVFLRRKDK